MEFIGKRKTVIKIIVFLFALLPFGKLQAQPDYRVTGEVNDKYGHPVGFATVALYNQRDSVLIAGTITDTTGNFEIIYHTPDSYRLKVSFIGYSSFFREIEAQMQGEVDLGTIVLRQNDIELLETKVIGERIKARKNVNETTYYVNNKMKKASNTAIDMVKFIPGVRVDLFQNVSLEGGQNVLILVNGVERDANFLSQLNSDKIDKIEINNNPGVKYRTEVSGVINVILKNDKNDGINGHVYAEVPVKSREVYSFPGASITYSFKKVSIYSSYNGEFSYFNNETYNHREILNQHHLSEIVKTQEIRQNTWSHKLNVGIDFFPGNKDQVNVYGFINPHSNEHDGTMAVNETAENINLNSLEYRRDDKDKNLSAFVSVYYKHFLKKTGQKLVFDLNYYHLNAENSITLFDTNSGGILVTSLKPTSRSFCGRVDYSFPVKPRLKVETGVKESIQLLGDSEYSSFEYQEFVSAAYSSVSYSGNQIQVNGGIRIELARLNSGGIVDKTLFSGLPTLNIKYDFSKKNNISFSYKKSIQRPYNQQLNPKSNTVDPYTFQRGNLKLAPSIHHKLTLDYSILFNNNFLSFGTFFDFRENVIENMTTLNDSLFFETTTQNMGNISYLGIKILGSLKPVKNVSFNPFLKFYNVWTHGNELAQKNGLENKSSFALESGFSTVALFKHDITLSATFSYNSPVDRIQGNYFEDVLYLLSLEKTFFENLNFGITTVIPFKRQFTYQGQESRAVDFREYTENNIKMSAFPFWFKLKYSFASGKKVRRINRAIDLKENKIKKGF